MGHEAQACDERLLRLPALVALSHWLTKLIIIIDIETLNFLHHLISKKYLKSTMIKSEKELQATSFLT